jgi:phosphoribosyl 1,2-cyclic phosphodiesterase
VKVKFYGTRGSIPVPGARFSKYGGNTTCVLITGIGGAYGILDAGSGLRLLGDELRDRHAGSLAAGVAQPIPILLSHTHWDHIQGFPFFKPAFDPRNHIRIIIHGRDKEAHNLERIFAGQMGDEYFPIPLQAMGASMTFSSPDMRDFEGPGSVRITASPHSHPGGAYGYRLTGVQRTVCYCTDVEHPDGIDERVVELAMDADLLIHDAQYTPEELQSKRTWGHSSWPQAVEVARRAGVKALALTHHDPEHDDEFLSRLEQDCQREFPESFFAREGMEIDLG